jgi:hypothetical protein
VGETLCGSGIIARAPDEISTCCGELVDLLKRSVNVSRLRCGH